MPIFVWPFNASNRKARKALETFTGSLREVIDPTQLREGTLAVVQEMMQPAIVTLWVRLSQRQQEAGNPALPTCQVADDDPLLAYLLAHPGTLEVEGLQLASQTLQTLDSQGVEILLPLVSQGELLGLLILWPRMGGQHYTLESLFLLNSLAQQVAQTLRVVELVQEQQAQVTERERIEQELRTAREIQQTFLPKEVPEIPGWQLVPYYHPAREVGGDFYDFIPLADGRLGVVIGDVAGKGIPAALVMTATRTMLRTDAQSGDAPGEVLARVNELLCADIPPGIFVTCFYAILDPVSGCVQYANAGHEPPYRWQNEDASRLWATGMPLGMLPGSCYETHEAPIFPGENLLFFSDGIVEAHNSNREMFGLPRLLACINAHPGGRELIDLLLGELGHFTGADWEQEDDVTLLALRCAPMPQKQADGSS
jgi:serine phosphatase RsbU (regulator of sigma subunit)